MLQAKKKFKATANSNHLLPVAENLLEQNFMAKAPNQVWVTDITYIPTHEGWLYLAGHKDLFNGEIVGYAMGERVTKNLVSQSLFRAVSTKRPAAGFDPSFGSGQLVLRSGVSEVACIIRHAGIDEPPRKLLR